MSKQTLINTLTHDFKGRTFTQFGVMTCASDHAELALWKTAFLELVESGDLVAVEQRPLGTRFAVSGRLASAATVSHPVSVD